MSSGRKKWDESVGKAIRTLASYNANRHCLDCGQRGPTYVNVTIGSFVCTKCSGILRGLTPPHRVKSISMATFTQEELEQLMSRGNEYCQKVWLALCETDPPTRDEQQIKDFMVDKYEKKRYYVEPSIAMKMCSLNGGLGGSASSSHLSSSASTGSLSSNKTQENIFSVNSLDKCEVPLSNGHVSGCERLAKPPSSHVKNSTRSVSSAVQVPNSTAILNSTSFDSSNVQSSFANFDNAPIFNSTPTLPGGWTGTGSLTVPSEDRYAALKDLDSQMKVASPSSDPWGSPPGNKASNDTMWSTATVTTSKETVEPVNGFTSNPFAGESSWDCDNTESTLNPFKSSKTFSDWPVTNGNSEMPTSHSLNSIQWFSNSNRPNPFAVGGSAPPASAFHSSNPFL